MPFDLNALFENPQFQSGIGILGAASAKNRPLLDAFQIMQQMKKQEQEKEKQKQELEYRKAQIEVARETAAKYGQQNEIAKQKLEQGAKNREMFMQLLQGQAPTMVPQSQPPEQQQLAPPPPEPVGKYGTPKRLLQNLMQVESGGNPFAIGPDIGGGVRAQGAFQFLPSTVKMLREKGISFDPFNPKQSEEAADYYLQTLVQENGGDYQKALAAYGGFKTKDATSYVNKVLQGSPEKMAQQVAQNQSIQAVQQKNQQTFGNFEPEFTLDNDEIKITLKPKKPEHVQPGSVRITPQGRETIPDPLGERNTAAREASIEIEREKEKRLARKDTTDINVQFAKDKAAFDSVSAAADRTEAQINQLISHPGRSAATGKSAIINPLTPVMPGSDRRGFLAKLQSLTSKLVNDTLQAVRQASANGASGYGQFTEKELKVVETYVENLDPGMNEEEFLAALKNVQNYMRDIKRRATNLYTESTGQKVSIPLAPDTSVSGPFSDPDKNRRYQEWKARQGK